MIMIYGIKNCDTMKKAFRWLEARNIPYRFHDYKKEGIDRACLEKWLDRFDMEELINRRGTTWKKLSDAEKESISDREGALKLIMANLSLIKRPLVETDKESFLGFDEKKWAQVLLE